MFAHDHLLVLANIELALRRDLVETTAAGVALDADNRQAAARIVTKTVIAGQQSLVDDRAGLFGNLTELLFFLLRLLDDAVEFGLLQVENGLLFVQDRDGLFVQCRLGNDIYCEFLYTLFGKLDLEVLVFDLFVERVEFAVILHLRLLGLVLLDEFLRVLGSLLLAVDLIIERIHFFLDVLGPGGQTGEFIFQVGHFHREFPADGPDLIDVRVDLLKDIQRLQFFFDGELLVITAHDLFEFALQARHIDDLLDLTGLQGGCLGLDLGFSDSGKTHVVLDFS